LRVFKLFKKMKTFRILVRSIVQTIKSMSYFSVLLFLLMMVFTLMGSALFANEMRFDEDGKKILDGEMYCPPYDIKHNMDCIPRNHFDDFISGFVTCFQILSGENWNAVWYDTWRATDRGTSVIFFLLVIGCGQWVVLNLFLALLMHHYEMNSSTMKSSDEEGDEDEEGEESSKESEHLPPEPPGYALGCLGRENPLRKVCIAVCESQKFENVILSLIIFSSLSMAWDQPLDDPRTTKAAIFRVLDIFFTVVFVIEMTAKHIAYGAFFGPTAYWRQAWNLLDGVVVLISVLDLLISSGVVEAVLGLELNGGILKLFMTLRMLRALRPLRVISRYENLKLVVNTLFLSVPELANLVIVQVMFLVIFGLLAVTFMKGRFYTCQTAGESELEEFAVDEDLILDGRMPLCLDVNKASASFGMAWLRPAGLECAAAIAAGTWANQSFVLGATTPPSEAAQLAEWTRPSADTPICLASCQGTSRNPAPDESVKPAHCPPPLTWQDIPSVEFGGVCSDYTPAAVPADHPWRIATARALMPCADVTVKLPETDESIKVRGCEKKFCTDSVESAACLSQCQDGEPLFCHESCSGVDTTNPTCKACVDHCKAACECESFCDPFMDDAGVCVEQGGMWVNMNQHFDDIFAAVRSLFEISTTEGWVDVMYAAMDAQAAPMKNPVRDTTVWWSFFFVIYIFVGTFFLLNLCVSVIVDKFSDIKEQTGAVLETRAQQQWKEGRRMLMTRQQLIGATNLMELPNSRRRLFLLVRSTSFESGIMACILLNTFVMAMRQYPPTEWPSSTMFLVINWCFAAIFTVEAVMKIYVLRGAYFKDGWNVFDFVCVVATLCGIFVENVLKIGSFGTVMSGVRLFRIARLFRLLRFLKGLNKLFVCFILTIPKLINVFGILMLLLFVFSVMGLNMFMSVHKTYMHNDHANFDDIWMSMLTLFRSMTGEAWNEMMHAVGKDAYYFNIAMQQPCLPNLQITMENYQTLVDVCAIAKPLACGANDYYMHFIFFCSFTIVMTFVILNLFVAVVLDGFDGSAVGEEEAIVQKCIEVWFRHDTNVDLVLPIPAVKQLMEDIEVEFVLEQGWKPLPPHKNKLIKDARYYVHDFMHCTDGRVTFLNATLGSMLVLLCHARIHERNGKWSDLAITEVKNAIEEIREVSRFAFTETKLPRNKEEQSKVIEQLKVDSQKSLADLDDAQMLEGRNFRAHVAAMSMQEKFREKVVARANVARSTIQNERDKDLARQVTANHMEKMQEEEEADEGANKPSNEYSEPGLPGGVDDEQAESLKPAVAG
jgi:hypothetical protein